MTPDQIADTIRWRREQRAKSLALFAAGTRHFSWDARLLRLLLEELWVEEEFTTIMGPVTKGNEQRCAPAVAIALALRHSWRRDDLRWTARRLGISRAGL
jgi:hypothetical protein